MQSAPVTGSTLSNGSQQLFCGKTERVLLVHGRDVIKAIEIRNCLRNPILRQEKKSVQRQRFSVAGRKSLGGSESSESGIGCVIPLTVCVGTVIC